MINLHTCNNFNINLDSDGILSFLLLKIVNENSLISGFNNSGNSIWSIHNILEDIYKDTFVDIFLPLKGVKTIDQHIIEKKDIDGAFLSDEKINPHILVESHYASDVTYFSKYPFSTFLFILSIFEKNGFDFKEQINNKEINKLDGVCLYDMFLRADGVLENCIKYRSNVEQWSDKLKTFSNTGKFTSEILDYALSLSKSQLIDKNEKVECFYKSLSLNKDGGYNYKETFENNIKNLNRVLRSFAKYLNVNLVNKKITLYEYIGEVKKIDASTINEYTNFDTYAFIGKEKISFTNNIKKSDKLYENIEIYT